MPNLVNISLGLAPLNSFGWVEHPIFFQRSPGVSESCLCEHGQLKEAKAL